MSTMFVIFRLAGAFTLGYVLCGMFLTHNVPVPVGIPLLVVAVALVVVGFIYINIQ